MNNSILFELPLLLLAKSCEGSFKIVLDYLWEGLSTKILASSNPAYFRIEY